MTMGRQAEAIAGMKKSQELDPFSLIISAGIGWAHYMDRQYDAAIEQLHRTIELDPNYPITYWILGLILRKLGRYDQAIVEGEKGVKFSGGSPMLTAALAQTLATAGRKKEAIQILDDLTKLANAKICRAHAFSPESTSAWEKTTAPSNAWKNPSKSIPTGSSTCTSIPAWTPCAPTRAFRTSCAASAFPLKHAIPA